VSAVPKFSVINGELLEFRPGGLPPVLVSYRLLFDGREPEAGPLRLTGARAVRVFSDAEGQEIASIEDILSETDGVLSISRRWLLKSPGSWSLGVAFSARAGTEEPEVFVPAVLYRGNEMGKGAFPKRSAAPVWTFLENRTPVPACVQLRGDAFSLLCSSGPAVDPALYASARGSASNGAWTVEFDLPGAEGPFVYSGKTALLRADARARPVLELSDRDLPFGLERTFYCRAAASAGRSVFGPFRDFVEAAPPPSAAPEAGSPACAVPWSDYRSLKFAHLLSLVEPAADGRGAYLAMGRGNGDLQDVYRYTAGSFLVKSLEGAWVISRSAAPDSRARPRLETLRAALELEPEAELQLDIAERIGRFFLAGERGPGVHQDCCDPQRDIWGGYLGISEHDAFRHLVNARCNGEAMKAYVLLYESLKERGREVPEFIELPRRVARFYMDRQLRGPRAGSFGRWWSPEGEAVDSLGTNGAYVASFLIALAPHCADRAEIDAALEAAGAYYAALARSGDFFADTLDADSCDKEAGAALLALFMDLHDRDGSARWLDAARNAAEFLLTWIWQYDIAFPPDSPLGSRGFSTRGMTSVSIAHHHLDFYGMAIAYDFLRFARASGDAFFEAQAVMMLRACRQLVATAADPLGRSAEEIGWQPEQLNHADWDYFDRPDKRNGSFDIDIAWVSVLGLGAYERIAGRFPEALDRAGGEA
jgi:hypothetical protein